MDKSALTNLLQTFGDIRMPTESVEPILAPGPRDALHEWLRELNSQDELKAHGIAPRTRALLFGPPGTGKTTMAHHLSARLGLPMLSIRSESVISKWVGDTGSNIGKLYDALRPLKGRIVLFYDEFDAIATQRQGDQAASVEKSSYLNVLLRRIEQDTSLTFAATNRHDMLDTAIWRRFDLQISVDLPGEAERFAILKRYAAPLDPPEADLDLLTEATAGASPDLLRRLMEGIKRSKILWPKLNGRNFTDASAVFASLLASVTPPPELQQHHPITLWTAPETITPHLTWPW